MTDKYGHACRDCGATDLTIMVLGTEDILTYFLCDECLTKITPDLTAERDMHYFLEGGGKLS